MYEVESSVSHRGTCITTELATVWLLIMCEWSTKHTYSVQITLDVIWKNTNFNILMSTTITTFVSEQLMI